MKNFKKGPVFLVSFVVLYLVVFLYFFWIEKNLFLDSYLIDSINIFSPVFEGLKQSGENINEMLPVALTFYLSITMVFLLVVTWLVYLILKIKNKRRLSFLSKFIFVLVCFGMLVMIPSAFGLFGPASFYLFLLCDIFFGFALLFSLIAFLIHLIKKNIYSDFYFSLLIFFSLVIFGVFFYGNISDMVNPALPSVLLDGRAD